MKKLILIKVKSSKNVYVQDDSICFALFMRNVCVCVFVCNYKERKNVT